MSRLVPKHKCGDVLEEIDPEKHGEREPIRYLILGVYNTDAWIPKTKEERDVDHYCFYHAVKCRPNNTIWGQFESLHNLYSKNLDMNYKYIGHIDLSLLINGNEQLPMIFPEREEQP